MLPYYSQFVYKNLYPVLEEVQRLDSLIREVIKIYDPVSLSRPTTSFDHHKKKEFWMTRCQICIQNIKVSRSLVHYHHMKFLSRPSYITNTLSIQTSKRRKAISSDTKIVEVQE